MTEKVCPRCGSMYEDLKSTTCPQCFAKLLVVDEATAEELRAARESVEQTPEFQAAKAEDDEKFREQSFGACLGVIVITLITVVVGIVLIASAVRRQHSPNRAGKNTPVVTSASQDPLTVVPIAGASLDEVMPLRLPPADKTSPSLRRISADENGTLPGSLAHIDHAVYKADEKGDVYAVPTSLSTPEENQFRLGVTLAAQMQDREQSTVFFHTQHWLYAAVGPRDPSSYTDGDEIERALAAYFRQKEH